VIMSVLVAFASTMPGAKLGRPIFCTGKERSDGCDAECDAGLAFSCHCVVRPAALSTKARRGDRETSPQSEARSCRNAGRPAGGTRNDSRPAKHQSS
jgi:hypothetical protein